ncbi:uncharacterized protein LOC117640978 [Thrips palmi]|uniref:Uncharacterized protein LOC117640978 n=1 Tax=Thrips palmi TaxID=161013 RepID=A0A6P8YB13_THRPL|nr:uncharacterized protein LOC117640978 [Thrips palmi]
MFLQGRLLLVALLGAPLFTAACDEFECRNGACVGFRDICDGMDDCGDGTDELAAKCGANAVPLAVNQNVTVRVQYKAPHRAIAFRLCDAASCSSLTVDSFQPGGGMSYAAGTACNARARGCDMDFTHIDSSPSFVSGEYEFVVGRLPGKLAVWQKGHRRTAATVAAAPGMNRLRVEPLRWFADLEVQFSEGEAREMSQDTQARNVTGPEAKPLLRVGATVFRGQDWKWGSQDGSPPGPGEVVAYGTLMRATGIVGVRWQAGESNIYRMGAEGKYDLAVLDDGQAEDDADVTCPEFQCKSGGCARFLDRCDGFADCADKSDEDAATCRANTVSLPQGRNTTARVQYKSPQKYIEFHACGKHSCSHVDVHGLTPAGKLSYVLASDCNKNSRLCALNFTRLSEGDRFSSGELEFVVARRPGWMSIWRRSHPEDVATVKVSDDADTLQIQPGVWVSDIKVQYTPVEPSERSAAPPGSRVVTGPGALPLLKVGARVMRGRDWDWGNQDGSGLGRVTSKGLLMRLAGVVGVRWDNGHENVYRMDAGDDKFDLAVVVDASEFPGTADTADEDTSTIVEVADTADSESDEDAEALAATGVAVGSRVVRGKDWRWDDQDGNPPGEGVVVAVNSPVSGWVSVRWPSGKQYNYRMGEKRDLAVLGTAGTATPTQEPATTTETDSSVVETRTPTTSANTSTTTVSPSPSTSTSAPTTEWEWLRPDSPADNSQSEDDSDDEAVTESATTTMSSAAVEKVEEVEEVEAGRVAGAEAAARLKPCSRVVRGKDWQWGAQDGTPAGEGRVLGRVSNTGWVSVRWPSGDDNLYRMGADGKYDLDLLETDEAPSAEADPHCALDKTDVGDKSIQSQPEVIGTYSF